MGKRRNPFRRNPRGKRDNRPLRDVYVETDVERSAADTAAYEEELSEDEAYDSAFSMHPDLQELDMQDDLPEEFIDSTGNVWRPRMHLRMHAIIERQLSMNAPAGIRELAIELEQREELHPHEIRHVMAAAVAAVIWEMTNQKKMFDDQRYFELIDEQYNEFVEALT